MVGVPLSFFLSCGTYEGAYWVWVRMDTSGLAFAGFYRAYNSIHYLFLINYFHIELMNFTHNYKNTVSTFGNYFPLQVSTFVGEIF